MKFYYFNIWETVRASANMSCEMILSAWRFSNILVSKVQMSTKLFLQICFHLYGTRRRVALVLIDDFILTTSVSHLVPEILSCEGKIMRREYVAK